MNGVVVVDANLLVLLVVGSASPRYIAGHERLSGYAIDDFSMLTRIISQFSDVVLPPHVLAEVSNLAWRRINPPARTQIQAAFRRLIESCAEHMVPSLAGVQRTEFEALGLTDAVILHHLCALWLDGVSPTLVTADSTLAEHAHSLGYSVIDYRRDFLSA